MPQNTSDISFDMGENSDNIGQSGISPETIMAMQALEIAREDEKGAQYKIVRGILQEAIDQIWRKVEARPDSYVMTRDEFAIFDYFRERFVGNEIAAVARKRYWDNVKA